ncbi:MULTISPECIES: hypothetical protein [Bradyrhizobium]|uniref:hypothetical protein n=1 Tax=Bradyrhizobium TaxID=374 RepID=UPI0004883882|nr:MULTISPECIES: hypothetical protein [Bradyrhizobium]QOG23483.1 hypothetical protein FOM02_45835 [Bradyrhizobium sp. SEMIA]UFW48490.1 hypothetical protein BaraCB756_40605 [Bradyrhizobium arachidis]
MEYAAIGLAIFGALLGLRFRFRVLLPFLLLLLFLSLFVAFEERLGTGETVLLIAAVQVILQAGYVIGLAVRRIFRATRHKLPATDKLPVTEK